MDRAVSRGFGRRGAVVAVVAVVGAVLMAFAGSALAGKAAKEKRRADRQLDKAMAALVERSDGPPAAISVIQRGNGDRKVHRAGVAEIGEPGPPGGRMFLRIASTAKAMSGAVALALVDSGELALDDTIGELVPALTPKWHAVTLAQLLQHTSGVPDYTGSPALGPAIGANPLNPPPPSELLSDVDGEDLEFTPGTEYRYSNSDNIIVGLMVEAATGGSYPDQLRRLVTRPLGLGRTFLSSPSFLPDPFIHAYDVSVTPPEDGSDPIDWGGWAWASGGVISTPANLNRFIRGYLDQSLFSGAARKAQFDFRPNSNSSPRGPGKIATGLALFRFKTNCGTVFGHTGEIPGGYTQFIAASRDGRRSLTFSISRQQDAELLPELRRAERRAVCAALAG